MTTADHIRNMLKDFKLTTHKIDLFDYNLHDRSTRFFKIQDKDGNKYRLFVFTERISIEAKTATTLHFSVNLPDNICLAKYPLDNNFGHKIFTSKSQDASILSCLNIINKEILDIDLNLNEGIFIYQNGIQLVVDKSRLLIKEVLTLQRIKEVLKDKFPLKSEMIDSTKLPSDLQYLIPILAEWAISDDVEREEKISKSSKSKLKKVIDHVSPKMNSINNYLDSFKSEPWPYEATLVANLAEIVSELTIINNPKQ